MPAESTPQHADPSSAIELTILQARKEKEIKAVMDDQKRKEVLDVNDLMRLFGEVGEDEEGVPFIYTQSDGDEHLRRPNRDSDDEAGYMGNDA